MSNRGDDRRKLERRNGSVRRLNDTKVDNEKRSGEERRDDDSKIGFRTQKRLNLFDLNIFIFSFIYKLY